MRTSILIGVATLLLVCLYSVAFVAASTSSDQDYVVVGEAAIEQSLMDNPALEQTVLLESDSLTDTDGAIDVLADIETEMSPFMQQENLLIHDNQQLLSQMELLAKPLGAAIVSDMVMEKQEQAVESIEHSLLQHQSTAKTLSAQGVTTDDSTLPTALLNSAPTVAATHAPMNPIEAEAAQMEAEVNMVELGSEISGSKNDYAFLDDPKHGGKPTVLHNLKGLDIYVVNTPIQDNDNEIRPVNPPHAMSAAMRERERLAALRRKELIHEIPEPKAKVKPKTRIDTLSAYEPSLLDSRPLKKLRRLAASAFDNPIVGGMGAIQMKNAKSRRTAQEIHSMRFSQQGMETEADATQQQQLPGTPELPHFPRDPKAINVVSVVGVGSSFDNRDGPPRRLDELLPLRAQLVEDLDPLGPKVESQPVGWGSPPANVH